MRLVLVALMLFVGLILLYVTDPAPYPNVSDTPQKSYENPFNKLLNHDQNETH